MGDAGVTQSQTPELKAAAGERESRQRETRVIAHGLGFLGHGENGMQLGPEGLRDVGSRTACSGPSPVKRPDQMDRR